MSKRHPPSHWYNEVVNQQGSKYAQRFLQHSKDKNIYLNKYLKSMHDRDLGPDSGVRHYEKEHEKPFYFLCICATHDIVNVNAGREW